MLLFKKKKKKVEGGGELFFAQQGIAGFSHCSAEVVRLRECESVLTGWERLRGRTGRRKWYMFDYGSHLSCSLY